MKVNDFDDDLLKLAEQAAQGRKCDNSIAGKDNDVVDAFDIIRKVKQSFVKSEEVFEIQEDLAKGDIWGHLEIIEKIGEGGVGVVYLAYDSILNREVAVKFLNPKSSQYISSKQFIEEARRIAKVRHPNVLAVFGANTYQNITGFWCDFLSGKTLDKKVIKGISWSQVLKIAQDLSRAIQEVHVNDIIHGDIKPLNIMLNKENQAILMDFGSGSDLQNKSGQITSSTPIIMAPELFKGNPKTKASDIYSLGIVFYFMSTNGSYPYKAKTLDQLKKQIFLKAPINFSQTIGPKKWIQLIKDMLCFDPDDSPTIEEVRNVLRKIKQAPAKRNKRITLYSLVLFLLGVTSVSLYSYYKLKSANIKTEIALNETGDYSKLMTKMLSSVSPIAKGKDVLMIDVIDDFIVEIKNSKNVSENTKAKSLYVLAQNIFNLGKEEEGILLLDYVLAYPQISKVIVFDVLLKKTNYNINKNSSDNSDLKVAKKELVKLKAMLKDKETFSSEYMANYLRVLGNWHLKKGDLFSAEKTMLKSLDLYNATDNIEQYSMEKALVFGGLGRIYSSQSQFATSADYYQKALDSFKDNSSRVTSNTLAMEVNLAINLLQSGQKEKGLEYFENLIVQIESLVGTDHKMYLTTMVNLAAAYRETNNSEKSIALLQKLIGEIEKNKGENSAIYLNAISNLAVGLMDVKEYVLAEKTYKKAIKISQETDGENSFNVLLNQYNLSELYYLSGHPEKTMKLLEKWLPIAQSVLGEKQIVTIEMQEAKAWAYFLLGNRSQAKILMNQVITLKKQVYGANNEVTLKAIKRYHSISDPDIESQ